MKKWIAISVGLLMMTPAGHTTADMQSSLQSWMNSGEYVNTTQPAVFESQAGGYGVAFGGMRYRTPRQQVGELANLRMPKISAGCGGIDMDLGGFGFVNKDQIVQQLRAIASNAKGLLFQMAITTVSSMLSNEMKYFKDKADFLNKFQMDSCQAASGLLQGAKHLMAEEDIDDCVSSAITDRGLDFNQARTLCTSGGARDAINTDPAHKNLQGKFDQGNLAWIVMMQDDFLRNNRELAVLLMNITGTVIKHKDSTSNDDPKLYERIAPWFLVSGNAPNCTVTAGGTSCESGDIKLLRDLMVYGPRGGTSSMKIFTCKDGNMTPSQDGCPDVERNADGSIAFSDASLVFSQPIQKVMMNKINSILAKIADKNATGLTADERALISEIDGPIYRYMLASTSLMRGSRQNDANLNTYIGALAERIVAERMSDMIDIIRRGMQGGKMGTMKDEDKEYYLATVEATQKAFNQIASGAEQQMRVMVDMQNMTQLYEKALVGTLSQKMLARMQFKG